MGNCISKKGPRYVNWISMMCGTFIANGQSPDLSLMVNQMVAIEMNFKRLHFGMNWAVANARALLDCSMPQTEGNMPIRLLKLKLPFKFHSKVTRSSSVLSIASLRLENQVAKQTCKYNLKKKTLYWNQLYCNRIRPKSISGILDSGFVGNKVFILQFPIIRMCVNSEHVLR